jgi:spore coat protein U-like protein
MFLKSKFSKTALASAFAVAAMVSTQSANAQPSTSNATLNVTAAVQSACTFDASTYLLGFGTIVIGNGGQVVDSFVDVTIACGSAQPYTLGASGTLGNRSMAGSIALGSTSAGALLNYELYKDNARSVPMGTNGANPISGTGTLGTPHRIYGRIPQVGNESAPAGNYADVISLTLTF